MKIEIYHLKDIAEFNLTDNSSSITLPEVQRGLVWKAHQVELLWDSILSEYPIGSFMIVNGELYDGQQRVTAITSGFDFDSLYNLDSPYSILWLDMEFQETTSRRYGFRLTTKAHPWGYNDGVAYKTSKRRAELDRVYPIDENGKRRNKEKWDIRDFIPCDANLPVPFAILLKALYGEDDFAESVVKNYKTYIDNNHCIDWDENIECRIKKACSQIYTTLAKIKEYQIVANVINNTELDNKYLELFFNRINTGGTGITPEELAYSAIKLYWQDENYSKSLTTKASLAMVNREMSKEYMPEAKFAQIVFRAICSNNCSNNKNKSIRGEIDAAYIRKLKTEEDKKDIVNQINKLYENDGEYLTEIMQKVTDNFGEIPKYVRVEIARDMPILYVLLFVIAKMQIDNEIDDIRKEYMQALTIYLYCCCSGNEQAIQYIYSNLKHSILEGITIEENTINCWIADCICYKWSNYVSVNAKDFKAFREDIISPKWNIWDYQYEMGGKQICQMFGYRNKYHQTAMLKIVEREAFKSFFNDYNPVQQDLWEQTNRPWDDDHIIPKDWITGKRPLWRNTVESLIWSIGNFAHIPFEENRSKRNKDDWSFYTKGDNARLLHFDEAITSTPRDFMNDEESSKKFIRVTTKRFCDIYEDFAKLLQPLRIGGHLSSTQETRKAILLSFKKNSDYKLYYVAGEGDGERDVEFDQEDNFGWMHRWVSVAKENSDSTLNSLTIGIESSECHIEVGERKDPRKSLIDTDNQSWWSLGMVMTETVESKNLTQNSVMELVDKASQNLGIHL